MAEVEGALLGVSPMVCVTKSYGVENYCADVIIEEIVVVYILVWREMVMKMLSKKKILPLVPRCAC